MERWRAAPGFELYDVSTFGRVRRSVGGRGARSGRVLSLVPNADGYLRAMVSVGSLAKGQRKRKRTSVLVHRLVAVAFIGDPDDLQVNHLDFDKQNNHVSNLEYVTHQQNIDHAVAAGRFSSTRARGVAHWMAVLNVAAVRRIRRLARSGVRHTDLAAQYDVTKKSIGNVVHRHTWKHIP